MLMLGLSYMHAYRTLSLIAIFYLCGRRNPHANLGTGFDLADLLGASHGIFVEGKLVFPDDGSAVLVSDVGDDVHIGSPEFKLSLPVDDSGERGGHQERTCKG